MQARKPKKNRLKLSLFLLFTSFHLVGSSMGLDEPEKKLSIDSVNTKAKEYFEVFALSLFTSVNDSTLNYEPFHNALVGYYNLKAAGKIKNERYLTIIDFSKPSNEERLFIYDVCEQEVIFRSIVSHGQNSGRLYANKFSNKDESHQSSIGFYTTSTTYTSHKYNLALRLNGLEYSNSHAKSRGIVMHAASYATYEFLEKYGVLGRSYGCPAMPFDYFEQVVNWIKEGSCMYIYYPSDYYNRHSKWLNKTDYLSQFII